MKLIHCADVHLDASLESVFSPAQAAIYRKELLANFARLVELTDENKADALLIAGDLFDSDNTCEQTVRYVLELFAAHPELSVFYLPGNHDGGGLCDRDDLPDNLHLFGTDWTYYDFGDLTIAGGTAPDPNALRLSPNKTNVVLLHGQVNGTDGTYNISFSKLQNKSIDYLALGHLHTFREASLGARGVACYSGCLMGRGFDECGPKGYVLLEYEPTTGRLTHRFVRFAARTLHEVRVDLSNCRSARAAETAVKQQIADIPTTDVCRLVLCGNLPPDAAPDLLGLQAALDGRFRLFRIKNETTLAIDPNDYLHDVSLKGEFIRQVLAAGLERTEQDRVITCGLRALRGEEPQP